MKRIILLIVVLSSFFNANATHLMGGEITWQCIKDPADPDVGKYIFTLKVYRDCFGNPLSSSSWNISVWDGISTAPIDLIPVLFDTAMDISPQCQFINPNAPPFDCYGGAPNNQGAVEELIWISQPHTLSGIPPATGWHFTWTLCCRNAALTNLQNPSGLEFTLRASMFPYFDPVSGLQIPPDPCFDSSPIFNEIPKTIICTGYPFAYSHNASDPELDSICYSWAEPLDGIVPGLAYNPGPAGAPNVNPPFCPFVALPPPSTAYTFNEPLPGNPFLDPETGEVSYNSAIAGYFATVIKVDAFKCGQKVASMYRDIQAVLEACDTTFINNNPPTVSAPAGTQTWTTTVNPSGLPSYSTTINAGALVTFNIIGTDIDIYPPIPPATIGLPQDITMEISGGQIAVDYITPSACDNPPCATFTDLGGNPPPIIAPSSISGVFTWQTDCNQILSDAGCGATTNIFTFLVKVYDDFCPANAITIATMKITMLPGIAQFPPLFQCATESSSGDVSITWDHNTPADPSTIYYIYGADNISGPYSVLASAPYPNDSYTINNIPLGINYYYMRLEALCSSISGTSDTIMPIQLDINSTNVNCWDDTDGRIAINMISNVITPFTYSLDGIPNPNAYPLDSVWENLPAGVYDVTISDNGSCIITTPISITAPGFPLQALVSGNMNLCYGNSDGFAVGFGAGGTPGYSYEWFDASSTSFSSNDTAFGLSSGSYYLEVTDTNGCDTSTSVQVIVSQTALSGSPQVFGVVCKGDSTGMLVGDAQGSWAPYQYYWLTSTGDTLQGNNMFVTGRDTLFGLSAGSYDLHVYDVQGCFVSYTINVAEPATKLSIDSMAVIESIACYGDSVGKARLYASGGMPNYAYLWDNGEIGIIADELTSGYHSVLLSDDWGCEVLDSIYIPENPEIQSQISTIQNASCYGYNDGSAWIESVGGVPTYTYFWSNGQAPGFMPDTANGLVHGSYYVTTRDVLGCEVVDSIYISEPEPLSMEAFELDWIDCYGADNGLAYATAMGGTAPYSFVWDNGQWTGDTINTLTPGLHTVVVTDAKDCSATDTVFTHQPIELTISIDDTQTVLAYCIGVNTASLTGIALGGTPGYTYQWDDNTINPQTTATASSLLAGVYTITVTDTKGCTASDFRDIDTLTNSMDADVTSLIQYIGGNDVSCFGYNDGGAKVVAYGAYAPYVYQWYGPNSFNSNNDSIVNLYAGTYSVTVRDINNCMVNRSILITQPDAVYFTTLGATDESCLGACNGQVQIDITGGAASYTALATDNTTGNMITSLMANDSVVPDLCSGTYTLTLIDANDCPSTLLPNGVNQQTIGTSVFTTANINNATTLPPIACNGAATGTLQVLNPNTNAGYSYSWQNANSPGVSISTTTQATNLLAGTYVLYAHYSDGNNLGQNYEGCTTTDTVSITQLSAIQSTGVITNVDCYGNATGSIMITQIVGGTPLAGTPSYNLQWNPGGQNSNLTAGTYTLTITDFNNCQEVDTFEVTQPQALSASISQNGYVLTANTPNGGTAPFSYSWREQSSNTHLQGGVTYIVINYGIYYVIVTDDDSCISQSNSFEYAEVVTGVEDELTNLSLSIYPNPFKKQTTVDFGRVIKKATISVVDVYGKLIEAYIISNTNKHIIKRNNKASGIYFVEIEVGEVKLFTKIIIE